MESAVEEKVTVSKKTQALVVDVQKVIDKPTFQITTQQEYVEASSLLMQSKAFIKALEAGCKEETRKYDEAKAKKKAWFQPVINKLVEKKNAFESAILSYQQAQEKKRLEEQERLEALKRKEAEKLEKKAEKAAEKGNLEKAEEIRQQAEETRNITPVIADNTPKVEGQFIRETWSAQVYDMKALVQAVAQGKAPLNFLTFNSTALNMAARASKNTLSYPGVRFVSTKGISNRT